MGCRASQIKTVPISEFTKIIKSREKQSKNIKLNLADGSLFLWNGYDLTHFYQGELDDPKVNKVTCRIHINLILASYEQDYVFTVKLARQECYFHFYKNSIYCHGKIFTDEYQLLLTQNEISYSR